MTDPFIHLGWLPEPEDWAAALERVRKSEPPEATDGFIDLANRRIDFIQTVRLDRAIQQIAEQSRAHLAAIRPVRLALLGSSTVTHLIPGIRVGALRRSLWVDVYEAPYGMYRQEIQDANSGLHAFRPDVILLSLDAHHLAGAQGANVEDILNGLRDCWRAATRSLGCVVLQQTVLPVFRPVLGNNEHRLRESPLALVATLNARLEICRCGGSSSARRRCRGRTGRDFGVAR